MLHLVLYFTFLQILWTDYRAELTLCAAGLVLLIAAWRWLQSRSRTSAAAVLTCLVLLATCAGGLHERAVFSPARWISVKPADRHYMLDDLNRRHTLTGMTGEEVRTLLGKPDYTDTDTLYSYVIDQPFDESTLDLTLQNGMVSAVSITPEH